MHTEKEKPTQTKEELEQACRKLQKIDRWYGILVVTGMAAVLMGLLVWDNLTVVWVGVILSAFAQIFLGWGLKCPYCGAHLKMKFGLPDTCPRCKAQLTKSKKE